MNKIYALVSSVFAGFVMMAQPISLSNSNMPGSGDTLRYSNAQLSSLGNYTQTGTGFTWNFSSLVRTSQGVRSFKSALQTPYAFFFFGLNEYGEKIADTLGAGPITMTNYYNYYKKQTSPTNAYIADGVGLTFSSVPVPSYYSDKDELYNFPMTYPKYDSTTFKFSTASSTMIPIKYSKTGYRVTVVDGWGTITTPYGTSPCLRLVTTQYSQDSIKNTIVPIPVGFPNYQRSYQWLNTTSKIPYLEITGNLSTNGQTFTPTQARFRDIPAAPQAVEEHQSAQDIIVYPNPVKDKLHFTSPKDGDYTVEIYDLKGSLVKSQKLSGRQISIESVDVEELKHGPYVMKISGNGSFVTMKFIKE